MRKPCQLLALALAIVGFPAGARSTQPLALTRSERVTPPAPFEVGTASWYGSKFQGRETTSGEQYNMFALTAAHRKLPFGTRIRVTNLANFRSLILRINDRGPVPKSRILDVSYAAARALGFRRDGLTLIRIDVVRGYTAQPRLIPLPQY